MSDDGQLPPAGTVGGSGDQFRDRGERTESLTAPEHLHGFGRQVPQTGGALVAPALGQLGDAEHRRGQCRIVAAVDHLGGPPWRGGVIRCGQSSHRRTW
jgi:hypothetical protein